MVERSSHQAFGAIESDFRPDRWSAQREQYKFTGKEEDLEVGLTYFGARYYHARLNRWISPDPLTIHGLGADLNPYAYVSGRALAAVDPFGLCAECDAPDGPTKGPDGTELAEVHAHSHRASPSAAADAQTSSSGMSFAAFAETLPSVRHLEQVVRAEWANGPVAQGIAAVNLARRDGAARTAVGLLRGGFGHNGNRLGQGVNLGDLAFGPPRSDAERVGARIASHIDDLVIRIASGYVGALAGLAMEGAAIANAEGAAAGAGTRAAAASEAAAEGAAAARGAARIQGAARTGGDIVGKTGHTGLRPTQLSVDPSIVEKYAGRLQAGEKLDPIHAVELPNGQRFIIEGHHRYVASQQTGIPVDVVVKPGAGPVGFDWKDVIYEAFGP